MGYSVSADATTCPCSQSRIIGDLKLFELTTNVRLWRYVTAENANRASARTWPPGTLSIIRATGYKKVLYVLNDYNQLDDSSQLTHSLSDLRVCLAIAAVMPSCVGYCRFVRVIYMLILSG
jgi:hypothetical protein